VGLPGLTLQDSWRFAFFAAGRGASALVNDLVWTSLLILALFLLHRSGDGSVVRCLLAFGGTASLAAVLGSLQAGVTPRPARVGAWLREHRQLSARYLVENVSRSTEIAGPRCQASRTLTGADGSTICRVSSTVSVRPGESSVTERRCTLGAAGTPERR
jgi:hypothetical protein